MLFLFVFVIRHALCRQKPVCKSVGQSIRGMGARRLMRRPAPTMLFLFAFIIRHASYRQKLYVNLLVSRRGQLTCRCCVRGTTLGITIGQISVALHIPLLHHQSAIHIEASPLPLLQKICISCTNRKAKLHSTQASN